MKLLYIIYQICIGLPIFLVTTILTALTTMIGCHLGNGHFWGYYPGKLWSQITCYTLLLPIKVKGHENIDQKQSYVFVANHQGSFDIFLIYGFLGRNFKWMMKKSLRKIPFVGKACESAGFIFVDKSGPRKIHETIEQAFHVLKDGTSLVVFPEGARTFTGHMGLPRTGKLLSWHPMKLTIHKPIFPKCKGPENIKELMEESYKVIESALPDEYKGKVDNPDQ